MVVCPWLQNLESQQNSEIYSWSMIQTLGGGGSHCPQSFQDLVEKQKHLHYLEFSVIKSYYFLFTSYILPLNPPDPFPSDLNKIVFVF